MFFNHSYSMTMHVPGFGFLISKVHKLSAYSFLKSQDTHGKDQRSQRQERSRLRP